MENIYRPGSGRPYLDTSLDQSKQPLNVIQAQNMDPTRQLMLVAVDPKSGNINNYNNFNINQIILQGNHNKQSENNAQNVRLRKYKKANE